MNERIEYIDMAKGIGIIAVIIGHMNVWKFNKIIYSFHMPLFFLLAGAFVSKKYSNQEYIKRKAKQLIIPYVFTCAILILLSLIENILKGTFDNIDADIQKWFLAALYGSGNIEKYGFTRIGAIWFLLAMFMSCVFIRFISDKKNAAFYVAFVVIVGYLTSWIAWLPFSIQSAMVASGYVYIGYVSRERHVLDRKFNGLWSIPVVIVWILTILFGKVNMARNLFKYGVFDFIGALCGAYIVLIICKLIDNKRILPSVIINMLCFYGRNSLIVLCFHFVELEMFPWSRFQNLLLNTGLSYWVFVIIKILIKIFIVNFAVLIIRRIRFLRKIFSLD